MEMTIERVTPWSRVLDAARWTVGKEETMKEPSDKFKRSILRAQHSPIRLLEFDIKIKGIPYCNAVHFVRHHIGCEKFQCTLRDDRNEEIDDRRKLPQDTPVNLWICANAESIINISRKRLCCKAEATTRQIWHMVRTKMGEVDPAVAFFMVRECVYRSRCPEMQGCGYSESQFFRNEYDNYWQI